jgi:hypothetical protein
MPSPTTTRLISILCCSPWYTELESSVTREVSQENWNSYAIRLNETTMATRMSVVRTIHPLEKIHLYKIWSPCRLFHKPSAVSAGCYRDTTSKLQASCLRRSPVSFGPLIITSAWKHRAFQWDQEQRTPPASQSLSG